MSFGAAKTHNVQPNRIARQTRSGQFGAQFPQLGVTAFPMLSRMSRIHPISGGKWDRDVDNERPLTSKFASAIHLTESTGVMLHTCESYRPKDALIAVHYDPTKSRDTI